MTDARVEWERCKPWIEAATKESPLADDIETIEWKLAAGKYQLASSANAAVLVERARFDSQEVLIARFGGGSLCELLDVIQPRLYEQARAEGRLMMSEGRLGWLKPAKARGYRLAWITMVKE